DFFEPFRTNQCDLCGECLTHCPVMSFSPEEGKKEMQKLVEGKPTSLLTNCWSCFTCNLFCKHGCNPTSLILQRWNEQYKKEGLRVRGRYFMTFYPNYPNFRSYALERMSQEECVILEKWKSLEPLRGDMLTYPGCNIILTPTLVQSKLFTDLDIRGRLEYCCGETLFRTGYTNELRQVARRLNNWFNMLKPKHLLVLCTAGTNVFKNILPHFGLNYNFDSITPYIEWLWNRLKNGEIQITHQLDLKVTIQDSCYSKMFGDEYMDLPRKILQVIGCEIVELPYSRENMRCCGIASGFSVDSAYHMMKMRKATIENLNLAKNTGADVLCVYCSGCNQTYHNAKRLYFKRFGMEIYHLIELLQIAIGEKPRRLIRKTAKNMFWGILRNQLPVLYSKKTFKLPSIPEDPYKDAY
ncbi:MAG: (Fe-S)-binding protein, partial [Candidatus Hodarchaeota archaeon]